MYYKQRISFRHVKRDVPLTTMATAMVNILMGGIVSVGWKTTIWNQTYAVSKFVLTMKSASFFRIDCVLVVQELLAVSDFVLVTWRRRRAYLGNSDSLCF
jgi:hypothetical protein